MHVESIQNSLNWVLYCYLSMVDVDVVVDVDDVDDDVGVDVILLTYLNQSQT